MAAMRASDSDQLAAKLGRPTATMSALRSLSAEQIGRLSDAIDEAAAAHQRAIDDAFRRALPPLPRRLLGWILRFADGRAGRTPNGSAAERS
jgi:hypothetical protein